MTWILTNTAREHHLIPPRETAGGYSAPPIEEIAHSLAQINRFTGHCIRPYSVAEHSLMVMDIAAEYGAGPRQKLAALMHDAHECIVGDVSSPVKAVLGEAWSRLEETQQNGLLAHYGLLSVYTAHSKFIKHCDLVALAIERRDLMPFDSTLHTPWPLLDTPGSELLQMDSTRVITACGHAKDWLYWAGQFQATAKELLLLVELTSLATPKRPDYVIEIDATGGPCWVARGGGDPEWTHDIDRAEVYATAREATDNAWAFGAKYPARKFVARLKPFNAAISGAKHPID